MLEPTNLTPVEMNTTRSAVLEKNEKIVVKEITTPELQPDECEVGIFSAGLCSSDIESDITDLEFNNDSIISGN